MMPSRWYEELWSKITHLPIALAYRIIWAMAKTGNRNAIDVYNAMWDANLSMPLLEKK